MNTRPHKRRLLHLSLPLLAASAVVVLGLLLAVSGILASSRHTSPSTRAAAPTCTSKFTVTPTTTTAGTRVALQGNAWPAGRSLGLYLVDPSHRLRPTTLDLLTVPQSGSWHASVIVPQVVAFQAVGDETTGTGAPQTIRQTIVPGSYLVYASAADARTFDINSVCPVRLTIASVTAHAPTRAATFPQGDLQASRLLGLFLAVGSAWMYWLGAGVFAALALAVCGILLVRRLRHQTMAAHHRRMLVATLCSSVGLMLAVMLVVLPPQAHGGAALQRTSATTAATPFYSDDFEADSLGTVPAGWTAESGTTWSVQLDGTQVLAQTSTSSSTLYSIYAGSASWTDYSVSASVKPGPGSTTANTSVVAIEGRHQDVKDFYSLLVKNGNVWYLGKKVGGTWTTLAMGGTSYTTAAWYSWTLTLTGSTISASIGGTTLATVTDSTFASGNIAFATRNQSELDNVVVTSTASTTPTPTATATPAPTATPAATPTATPYGGGSISGQVTDSVSGAGIAGAQVSTIPATTSATTDSNGNYLLQHVAGNTYDVVISATGYNTNHVPNVYVTNGTTASANSALDAIPAYTAMDEYTQPNQSGWNLSTDGSTWLDDAATYPGATTSIQNNLGYADTYTAGTDRDEWMSVSYADQLVSADFEVLQYGQDSYQHGARLLGRIQDNNDFIDFAINYATSTLQIWVDKANNWVMLSQVSVPAFQTGQWYHAQLLTIGTVSYGKVWASGTAEPGWMIAGSQTSLTTGSGGVRSTYADINWSNFRVQAVTTITGVVQNTSGSAIAGATVSDGRSAVTTDSAGRYSLIEPNASATYTVTASAQGYTAQSAAVTTTSLSSTTQNFALT